MPSKSQAIWKIINCAWRVLACQRHKTKANKRNLLFLIRKNTKIKEIAKISSIFILKLVKTFYCKICYSVDVFDRWWVTYWSLSSRIIVWIDLLENFRYFEVKFVMGTFIRDVIGGRRKSWLWLNSSRKLMT